MEYIHLITGYTWVLCGMGLKSRAAIFFGSKAVEEQLSLVGLVVYVVWDLVKGRDQVCYVFCPSKKSFLARVYSIVLTNTFKE